MRRWVRRIGVGIAILFIAVTLAAVGFDLASGADSRPAAKLYRGPFVRVDGALIAYRRWGRSGSPIVLLGGAAEPAWVWHVVGPLLAGDRHRVYAIDLPPFGYSERRGPYTMPHWLTLLSGFERRLAIVRPLLVGHSIGAGVAAAAALADPASVTGIVLLDGDALPFGGGRGWLGDLLVYPYFTAAFRILTGSDWLVARVLRNAWGPDPPHFRHDQLTEFERPFRVSGTANALKQLARNGLPGVSAVDLARLRVPRTVLWGAEDNVDSLPSGRTTASVLRVPLQLIPNAGHLTMLARPRAVAVAIEAADHRAAASRAGS